MTKKTQTETLKNIKNIDQLKRELQQRLDTSVAGKSLSKKEQEEIIERIGELDDIRSNLYSNMNDMYKNIQSNVAQNRSELVNQMVTSGIVENELNNAKASFQALEDNRNNKLRMVEINNYFGSRYREYSKLMKHVVYFCIPVLILAFLARKELVPLNIANGLISLIIAIAIIVLGRRVYDLGMRDNMNFDEYNWYFNPNNVLLDEADEDDINNHPDFFSKKDDEASRNFFSNLEGGACVGEECCGPNMKYSKSKKKCVSNEEAVDLLENVSTRKKESSTIEAFSKNETFASY